MGARTTLSIFRRRVDSLLQGIAETVLPAADRNFAVREAIQTYNRDMPRRTTTEFPGDGGGYYLLHGKVVDVDEANQDADIDLQDDSTSADEQLAVQFTLDRKMVVRGFGLYLQRTGSTVEGTLAGSIYTDASNLPGALIQKAENIDIDSEHDGAPEGRYGKVLFTLEEAVELPAGTYQAVLNTQGYTYASGTNEVLLGVQQGTGATATVSAFDGTIWAVYGTDSEGILEVTASTPGWKSLLGGPLSVEYPAADIDSDETPNELEQDQYEIYLSDAGSYLRFLDRRPATTEIVRINVSEAYEWLEGDIPSIDTPPEHFEAICYLSASLSCVRIASKFGQKRSSTLSADVADRSTQGRFYRDQAKDFRKYYESILGIGDDVRITSSAATVDLDLEPPTGDGFIFHGKRTR